MTREVLAHGDDDARGGGPGRALGAVVAVALLAVFGVAAARSRDKPDREARPTPTPAPARPTGPVVTDGVDERPPSLPFQEFVTLRRPPPGVLRTVLLPDDVPGFLVPTDDPSEEPVALAAFGGPTHDVMVVGWCAATELLQDPAGTHFYTRGGLPLTEEEGLARYRVRRNARDPLRLDIDTAAQPREVDAPGPKPAARPCPDPLYLPTLPKRVTDVHDTVRGHRVIQGRYVVTTETRAFCTRAADAACAGEGWESYGSGLPPDDLAGSYTWEGDFVVRGDTAGRLSVARLPGARLVKRERVGVRAVHVTPLEATRSGGTVRLRVEAGDDERTYVLRPDCEVFLGQGVTGLGQPRGTGETLWEFLLTSSRSPHDPLWLVLDKRGRALRVVAEP